MENNIGKFAIPHLSTREQFDNMVEKYNTLEGFTITDDLLKYMDYLKKEIYLILKDNPEFGSVELEIYQTNFDFIPQLYN